MYLALAVGLEYAKVYFLWLRVATTGAGIRKAAMIVVLAMFSILASASHRCVSPMLSYGSARFRKPDLHDTQLVAVAAQSASRLSDHETIRLRFCGPVDVVLNDLLSQSVLSP